MGDNSTSDEDEEEEITLSSGRQREQKKLERRGFNPSFEFEEDFSNRWTLDNALQEAMQQKKGRTTLAEKINDIRNRPTLLDTKPATTTDTATPAVIKVTTDNTTHEEEENDENEPVITDTLKSIERKGKRAKIVADDEIEDMTTPIVTIEDAEHGEAGFADGKKMSWDPSLSFQDMNLSRPLLKAISGMNYI